MRFAKRRSGSPSDSRQPDMREGWRLVLLGDVARLDCDRVPVEPESRYDMAGVLNAGQGLFAREPIRGVETNYPVLHRLHASQLVMRKLTAWEGPITVVPSKFEGYFVSTEFPTFSLDLAHLDPRFMRLLCGSPSFWEQLRLRSTGTVQRRKRVAPRDLLSVPLLLPPLLEQRRIVDLVRSADGVIAAAAQLGSSSAVAASRVREEHFSERQMTTPAGEFFEITMGRQRSPRHASGDHIVPYLRAANAKDGRLDLTDVKAMNFSPAEQVKYHLEASDVLVTEGCGSLAQLGASAQWHAELPGVVGFQNTLLRIRGVEGRSLSDYAFQWARWCFEAGRFAAVASGTNIFHVGADRAKAMVAPDVTLEEQREFLDAVDALDLVASQARSFAARATDLRLAVLADLLSGSHEIPESYDALLEPTS